ncbi:MAG: hypothetical protein RIS47_1919, partial [Bacteroidota bacterium]
MLEQMTSQKPHPITTFDIHPLLAKRWSPRAFSKKLIEKESIMALFEAARWAPSAYNEQPWRFIYAGADNVNGFERLSSCLMGFNAGWATKAPLLVVAIAKDNSSHNDKPNPHAWHDLGLALGNLTLEATARDLYMRQMGGFDANKVAELYNLPAGFKAVTMLAIGYLGDASEL